MAMIARTIRGMAHFVGTGPVTCGALASQKWPAWQAYFERVRDEHTAEAALLLTRNRGG